MVRGWAKTMTRYDCTKTRKKDKQEETREKEFDKQPKKDHSDISIKSSVAKATEHHQKEPRLSKHANPIEIGSR